MTTVVDGPEGEHAAERVRRRLRDWLAKEGQESTARLARAVDAKVNRGRATQDIRLRDLDAIAEEMGIPVGELVQPEGADYIEVTPIEMRMIRHLRAMPDSARDHWLANLTRVLEQGEPSDAKDESKEERPLEQDQGGDALLATEDMSAGMTLRDHFAAQALAGMCASRGSAGSDADAFAQFAYKCADAMLRASGRV